MRRVGVYELHSSCTKVGELSYSVRGAQLLVLARERPRDGTSLQLLVVPGVKVSVDERGGVLATSGRRRSLES